MTESNKNITPPRLGQWLLESFCSYDFQSTALWDLEELFQHHIATKGVFRARWLYYQEVFSIIFHLFSKGKSQHSLNNIAMFKHNLIISLRNFKRYKGTFLINLFGLAAGLASALLIFLWVNDELTMDRFREIDSDRHYQVLVNSKESETIRTRTYTPGPLTKALEADFPEIAYGIPIISDPYYKGVLSINDVSLRAFPLFVGDQYFNVFSCEFLYGNKKTALTDQNNIVISEPLATSLFQSADKAVGQMVNFKSEYFSGSYRVTGVFKPNRKASVQNDIIFTFERFLTGRPELRKWINGGVEAHLVLNEGVDVAQFNAKIKDYLFDKTNTDSETLMTQKYSEKYLYGQYDNGVPVAGRMTYVKIFSFVALFVVIIACINYMNLATAQASRRVKEIGVKKVVGAHRRALMYQYFAESVFMSSLSLVLALGLVMLLLPRFNEITGKQLAIEMALDIGLPILFITLLTGVISGIYPGLYLSGFKPVLALKGQSKTVAGGIWLRKGLVIFQFATSLVLIITVIITYKQTQYVQTANLGYDKEHIISFEREGALIDDAEAFLAEANKLPGVVHFSSMWGAIPGEISGGYYFKWKDQDPEDLKVNFSFVEGHYNIAELLGVELIEGRLLSDEFATDDMAVVINETAAKLIGYENPVGEKFYARKMCEIVGVVKDFHYAGLQEKIAPFFFILDKTGDYFVVKIEGNNQRETIQRIEELHESFNPGLPFEFKYLDVEYQALYEEESRVASLSRYFAAVAIGISCLGLLALTAFSTQRRFKEVAIRKVLGSSSLGIIRLLSREFIILIFLSILIALPVGYYLMQIWLQDFAYRIDLKPVFFILAGGITLAIAWFTIVTQTAKSSRVNVSESLRLDG